MTPITKEGVNIIESQNQDGIEFYSLYSPCIQFYKDSIVSKNILYSKCSLPVLSN